jgi:hypothetical protein
VGRRVLPWIDDAVEPVPELSVHVIEIAGTTELGRSLRGYTDMCRATINVEFRIDSPKNVPKG